MNSKKISTALLIIAAITVLAVLAFHVRIGATADSVAVLKTTGMTCGSCSRAIARTLERVKGVAATEVDVDGGWVIVGYDTRTVQPESLVEKVNGAGFESTVYRILTPEQFKLITGKDMGSKSSPSRCCGGCGT
jgi:periplasmic mercuric ion binding protein